MLLSSRLCSPSRESRYESVVYQFPAEVTGKIFAECPFADPTRTPHFLLRRFRVPTRPAACNKAGKHEREAEKPSNIGPPYARGTNPLTLAGADLFLFVSTE